MIRTALLSVSDKSGIVPFAQKLHQLGIKLISTGGTAKLLMDYHLPVVEVASLTNFPEMLDVKPNYLCKILLLLIPRVHQTPQILPNF